MLDHRGELVAPVEAFLPHRQALTRSLSTIRTYATSLKLWWVFLDDAGCEFDAASVDHVARFVAWLCAPAENLTAFAAPRRAARRQRALGFAGTRRLSLRRRTALGFAGTRRLAAFRRRAGVFATPSGRRLTARGDQAPEII